MVEALPVELVDRFRAECIRLTGGSDTATYGVAVSGGPDSLALLLLAAAAFPGRVRAATVDHAIRPASADEAAFVAEVCATLDVPHATLRIQKPLPRGNLSARLRELRYALLNDWGKRVGIDWLMTGHHADDQVETVVMRLNRGAGIGGLAAIRARNGTTIRPLLGWRHRALEAVVALAGLVAIEDPSNHDDRYDRARLRKMLADADWLDPLAIANTAAAFDDADNALAWSARHWARSRVRRHPGAGLTFDPKGLPAELVRRILLGCLTSLNPHATPTGPQLSRLHKAMLGGGKATLDGIAFDARTLPWRVTVAPPRRRPASA